MMETARGTAGGEGSSERTPPGLYRGGGVRSSGAGIGGFFVRDGPILLVEDSPDDVALALRAFERCGIRNEVVVARDGVEALDHLFAAGATMPLLVLLDLEMPGVGGLEVLRRVRGEEHTRILPVVILTSSSEQRDVRASYDLGASDYISKPVDFAQFVEIVEQIKRRWLPPGRRPAR